MRVLKERSDGSLEGITWKSANRNRPNCLCVRGPMMDTTISLAAPNDFWVQFRTAVTWLAQAQGARLPEDPDKYGRAFLLRYGLWARPITYYIVEDANEKPEPSSTGPDEA